MKKDNDINNTEDMEFSREMKNDKPQSSDLQEEMIQTGDSVEVI